MIDIQKVDLVGMNNDTHTFLFWVMGAGVHDAFPPPMCCVDCLRVSFGRIARRRFCLFVRETVHMNQHHRCCTFDSPGLIEYREIYPG